MRREDLHRLLADLADAPGPKVTITLPTHRQDPNGERDRIRLKNLVKQASHDLEAHARDREELQRLRDQLESVAGPVDHRQLDHGMAIFAAADATRTVHLTHAPIERALVADRFATRELHRDVTEATATWILALSTGGNDTDGTQLFHLHRGELNEHRDDVLPADWDIRDRETRFSEMRPDSPQRDAYIEDFLRRTEEHVAGIIGTDPLVLAGIERLRSHYHAITKLGDQIVAEVDGNFDNTPGHVLAKAAEEGLVEAHERELEAVASQIDEQAGTPHVATGIDDCEKLTGEGRVAELVLERSYLEPVVVDDVAIGDRVEVTIRQTHEHGGRILAVPWAEES
jgi:hypothetical protein